MTDLVVVSLEAWDAVWRRNQHLVAGLLNSGAVKRVLFVEPPIDTIHEVRSRRQPQLSGTGVRRIELSGAHGELWALRPRKSLPRRIDPRGDRRRARGVALAAQNLGMDHPVLWVNDPGGAELLELTGWLALYDITDDWLLADRPASELARLHRQEEYLLAHCGEVVVCSPALQRTKSAHRDVRLIPNAVNLEPYRVLQTRPPDLPSGPLALYVGTTHRDRVDLDLVRSTAVRIRERTGGTVVLVGPTPLPPHDVDSLRAAGVAMLGPRPSDTVPAYLQHADALIVPHVLTEFTASLDPIKAYEYRAARRPVVATPVPGFVDSLDSLVTTAEPEDFPEAVEATLKAPAPSSGALPDDIPSWSQRVGQISAVIARLRERDGS